MPTRLSFIAILLLAAHSVSAADVGNDSNVLLSQARSQIDAQQFDAALATLSQVVQIEPRNADALNLLGFASRKTGALDRAAGYYEAALKIEPDHFGALEYQGELFLMTDRPDLAQGNLDRLAQICAPCAEHDDLAAAIAAQAAMPATQ